MPEPELVKEAKAEARVEARRSSAPRKKPMASKSR